MPIDEIIDDLATRIAKHLERAAFHLVEAGEGGVAREYRDTAIQIRALDRQAKDGQ